MLQPLLQVELEPHLFLVGDKNLYVILKVQQHRMIDEFLVLESPLLSPFFNCICYELELEILKKHGSTNCSCFVASV